MAELGYVFRDPALLRNALTHSSYHNEHPAEPSNERLEFLGDSVLGFLVSELLYESYPEHEEGPLTALKARAVGQTHLVEIGTRLGIAGFMLLGHGERREGEVMPSIVADALEAVIAAVFLDGGVDAARIVVRRLFGPAVLDRDEDLPRDHKSELQALVLGRTGALPRYRLVEETGPDHLKEFVFEVSLPGGPAASGRGSSKKAAQQAAAAALLAALAGTPRP